MYLDLLFLLNLTINYFLLLFTAKLFRRLPGFWRLAAGAILGALAVLLLKLPHYPALTMTATLLLPITMVAAVFWPLRWLELFLLWGAFFLVSFMTGGAVFALAMLKYPGDLVRPPQGIALLLGVCLGLYLLLGLLRPYLEERRWQNIWKAELLVTWQGREKKLSAYLDTGNRLREPLSQRPVIVTHFRSLEGMIPSSIFHHLSDPALEPWMALQDLEDLSLARCFSLVPFSGVGARGGMLLGFKPDTVIISRGNRQWQLGSHVILGLTGRGFGPVAEYQALLPPELMQAG